MRLKRGYTLVELLIVLLITAIVMAGLVATVQAQQSAYIAGQHQRGVQSQTRAAVQLVEQYAMLAGYGVEPAFALDFGWYSGAAWCPDGMACDAVQRDQVANSDELVFYARNPSYWVPEDGLADPRGHAWRLVAVTSDTITVKAFPGATFLAGQVLQLVCAGGNQYAYVTVDQVTRVAALAAGAAEPAAGSDVAIHLAPSLQSDPFRRQDAATHPCFTAGSARAFQIDRFRFHVRPVVVSGTGTTATREAYLVLDRGVDVNAPAGIGPEDEQILAEGIESLQVSYVFTNPGLPPAGDTAGAQITFAVGAAGTAANTVVRTDFPGVPAPGQGVYEQTSWYRYPFGPPLAAERTTNHQANVRALRIALVGRAAASDHYAQSAPTLAFNQNAAPAWISGSSTGEGYQRVRFETTIPLRNMTASGLTWF